RRRLGDRWRRGVLRSAFVAGGWGWSDACRYRVAQLAARSRRMRRRRRRRLAVAAACGSVLRRRRGGAVNDTAIEQLRWAAFDRLRTHRPATSTELASDLGGSVAVVEEALTAEAEVRSHCARPRRYSGRLDRTITSYGP